MDLKNTKATAQRRTEKQLKRLVQSVSTEKLSLESDSFYERGLCAEDVVLKHYTHLHYEIIYQRWKTPFAEIDLLLRAPEGHLVLVEVKTLPDEELIEFRIGKSQKNRLRRAYLWVLEHEKAEFHFAVVSRGEKVQVLTEILNIS